jgi:NADH-quinone oxidoreductase subunit C
MTNPTEAPADAATPTPPATPAERLAAALVARFGDRVRALPAVAGEVAIEVAPEDWRAVCLELRDATDLRFEQMVDLSGIDYLQYGVGEWKTDSATRSGFSRGGTRFVGLGGVAPTASGQAARYAVVVHLLSVSLNWRLRVQCPCAGGEVPIVDSLVGVWAAANWYEREAFDLYGILFNDHPDLRRLLTDYGFIGHPFRKDFPVSGHVEVRYDPTRQRVVYEPVSIEPRVVVPKTIREDNRYAPGLTARPAGRG